MQRATEGTAVSRPPARHLKPSQQSIALFDPYDDGPYDRGVYAGRQYDDGPYDRGVSYYRPYDGNTYDRGTSNYRAYDSSYRLYGRGPFEPAVHDEARYDDVPYGGPFSEAPYREAPYREAPYREAPYREAPYREAPYRDAHYDDAGYDEPDYDDARYDDAPYEGARYEGARYDGARYDGARYEGARYEGARYDGARYERARYEGARYDGARYDGARCDDAWNGDAYEDARYGQTRYDRGGSDRRDPPGRRDQSGRRPHDRRGAHARHKKASSLQRKPVRIAAALAGSTLLVSAAAPAAAHWWHRSGAHPTALDQESFPGTGGAALGAGPQSQGQPAAPRNALEQWAQIPIGRHAATQVQTAKRRAKRAAPQPSHAPQPQAAPPSPAYLNPLRAVSDLVLERVDMGVDFGGAGPVYALGDGVITNATADSPGWPGGGWITYQLTDGPDAGLMVYVAEDVTPTVQVGQKVTSSTVIADMFNGGDGIETGWATSDGSTAESEMVAAGGISGNGPFPTMVGLSFDAVLENVGVPAAPNANEAGNGLLPAGYPPV